MFSSFHHNQDFLKKSFQFQWITIDRERTCRRSCDIEIISEPKITQIPWDHLKEELWYKWHHYVQIHQHHESKQKICRNHALLLLCSSCSPRLQEKWAFWGQRLCECSNLEFLIFWNKAAKVNSQFQHESFKWKVEPRMINLPALFPRIPHTVPLKNWKNWIDVDHIDHSSLLPYSQCFLDDQRAFEWIGLD